MLGKPSLAAAAVPGQVSRSAGRREIATAIAFLASDYSSYLTGEANPGQQSASLTIRPSRGPNAASASASLARAGRK